MKWMCGVSECAMWFFGEQELLAADFRIFRLLRGGAISGLPFAVQVQVRMQENVGKIQLKTQLQAVCIRVQVCYDMHNKPGEFA